MVYVLGLVVGLVALAALLWYLPKLIVEAWREWRGR